MPKKNPRDANRGGFFLLRSGDALQARLAFVVLVVVAAA
jgi:hypothetical protein